jgi:hypothetical protein
MSSGRLEPAAVRIEVGINADGASDGVEREQVGLLCRVTIHHLQILLHDAGNLAGASSEEAGGMSVTINVAAVSDSVVLGNFDGTAPANEVAFDGVAIGMRAD